MKTIAKIYTDFPEKFGIPRQPGIVKDLEGTIIFEPMYRQKEAFRGLEEFDYIWLLFRFHLSPDNGFCATVKPPKLGGNKRMGVFATRSPFRPNNIGLSSVRLSGIEYDEKLGPVLHVLGADLVSGTPILDIKPYLPYSDSHEGAGAGFSDNLLYEKLDVEYAPFLSSEKKILIPPEKEKLIFEILSEDPRPGYHSEDNKEYGVSFAGLNIRFYINGNKLYICNIERL